MLVLFFVVFLFFDPADRRSERLGRQALGQRTSLGLLSQDC